MQHGLSWDKKRILFVTGKGGVGKSLVAAAIARQQAARGRKVLLVEVGENSYYKDFWHLSEIGQEPRPAPGGFDLALWSGEGSLREYVLHYLKVQRLYELFFENKVMRALVNVAPGLAEISILGKITSGIRRVGPLLEYDLIVVDTFATGHALALFRAPKGIMEAIKFGPMGHQSREIQAVLQNPEMTGYLVVTLLEELPVVETLELRNAIQADLGVPVGVVANKVLPIPVSHDDLELLHGAAAKDRKDGLKEFAGYLLTIDERQRRFLQQLSSSATEVIRVPLIFSSRPEELVQEAAAALSHLNRAGTREG